MSISTVEVKKRDGFRKLSARRKGARREVHVAFVARGFSFFALREALGHALLRSYSGPRRYVCSIAAGNKMFAHPDSYADEKRYGLIESDMSNGTVSMVLHRPLMSACSERAGKQHYIYIYTHICIVIYIYIYIYKYTHYIISFFL